PAQVMAAVRGEVIKRYAFPRFMGSLVSSPKALPLLLALPIFILYAIAAWPLPGAAAHGWEFGFMFPQARLEELFFAVSALVLLAYAAGVVPFVRALRAAGSDGPILPALGPVLAEIVTHRRFSKCTQEKSRYSATWLGSSGSLGLPSWVTLTETGPWVAVLKRPWPTSVRSRFLRM